MKHIFIVAFTIISITTLGQTNSPVKLNWKISPNEKLTYLTLMQELSNSSVDINFGDFFSFLGDSSVKATSAMKDLFKELNKVANDFDHITTLTNKKNGIIDIEMMSKPKNDSGQTKNKTKDLVNAMQDINDGIILRGSVYATGGIHSFWVRWDQKNLISLFFELPSKPVRIGESWPLDISLIGNDQNFKCDTSYRLNKVTFVEIKKVKNEEVAVLKYEIVEYVKGIFNAPGFFSAGKGPIETMMKFTHQGLAEFSIDKGRWISYDGLMSLEADGFISADKKTKFSLVEIK